MTAKKAQISTIILLVVPLGFSIGTELLKTIPHSSQTDFPIVNVGPPGSVERDGKRKEKTTHALLHVMASILCRIDIYIYRNVNMCGGL